MVSDFKHKTVFGLCLCVGLMLSGCEDMIPDLRWAQQKTVKINSPNFKQCVTEAIETVPGVLVNSALSDDIEVILNVKFDKDIPFFAAFIQKRKDDSCEIMFTGKGAHESDQQRAAITPLLDAIATAIQNKCSKSL